MASIFISYAREDMGTAQSLANALGRNGHSVWWDRHIKGGTQFAAEIEAALEKAEAVIVLWSSASVGSPWVRDEASAARDSGRLVPASLGGALPPMGFRQYQSVDLTGWKGRRNSSGFAALSEAVEGVLAGSGMPERPQVESRGQAKRPLWRRPPVIAAISALLIVAIAAAVYLYQSRQVPAHSTAMVVLPFDALPADATNSPFAEGLAEEISRELARNPRLQLIGRTSASMFKDSNADAKTIGRKLRVAYLLDGSVQRAGNRVRVAIELIRASDGVRLWQQSYNGTLDDILTIEDRIGQSVEGQLRATLVGREGVTARSLATRGDVYGYYLTARSLLRQIGEFSGSRVEAIDLAEALLRKALAIDPNYAPAWAQLSGAMLVQGEVKQIDASETAETFRKAGIYADRALALAPQLAEAHYAKARTLIGPQGRTEGNLRGLQTAARLDPNNADAWFSLANYYSWAGDYGHEIEARRKALALEPLWVLAYWPAIDTAWQLGFEQESLRYLRRVERDATPQPFQSHLMRSVVADHDGDWSESLRQGLAANRSADGGRRIFTIYAIGTSLRWAGELEQARLVWPNMDDVQWNLWHGRPPTPAQISNLLADSPARDGGIISALLKSLVTHGRSTEVVEWYRRRFGAPDKLQPYPREHSWFVVDATTIAVALRDVGLKEEADRVLALVRRSVDERLRRGPVPRSYFYRVALVAAAQGDDQSALRWLERANANKWWYVQELALPEMADEPAFRNLKKYTRFQAIAARQRSWQAKEQREIAPMLQQLAQVN